MDFSTVLKGFRKRPQTVKVFPRIYVHNSGTAALMRWLGPLGPLAIQTRDGTGFLKNSDPLSRFHTRQMRHVFWGLLLIVFNHTDFQYKTPSTLRLVMAAAPRMREGGADCTGERGWTAMQRGGQRQALEEESFALCVLTPG
jgi:hypothetical protein